jgi:hypothetical protein
VSAGEVDEAESAEVVLRVLRKLDLNRRGGCGQNFGRSVKAGVPIRIELVDEEPKDDSEDLVEVGTLDGQGRDSA